MRIIFMLLLVIILLAGGNSAEFGNLLNQVLDEPISSSDLINQTYNRNEIMKNKQWHDLIFFANDMSCSIFKQKELSEFIDIVEEIKSNNKKVDVDITTGSEMFHIYSKSTDFDLKYILVDLDAYIIINGQAYEDSNNLMNYVTDLYEGREKDSLISTSTIDTEEATISLLEFTMNRFLTNNMTSDVIPSQQIDEFIIDEIRCDFMTPVGDAIYYGLEVIFRVKIDSKISVFGNYLLDTAPKNKQEGWINSYMCLRVKAVKDECRFQAVGNRAQKKVIFDEYMEHILSGETY